MRVVAGPTAVFAGFLIVIGLMTGAFAGWTWTIDKLAGLGRYFAFCLLQEFGLQSFFTNRLLTVFKRPHAAAWTSAFIFAVFHIPNPVLIPVTLMGGYVLSRIFIDHRNIIPLAIAQAVVGSLLALILPTSWHHGLRVGPGYYR
jgi:membrane protease YdiL (CAAX protease family)